MPPAILGILCSVLAGMTAAVTMAIAKHLGGEIPPFEIAFFRNLLAVFVMIPWFLRVGRRALRTPVFGLHAVRSMAGAVGMLAWFWAIANLPLAQVTSLNFSSQLFAVIFAMMFLGERPQLWRWGALITGFAGVLIILRPDVGGISTGALAILLSAFLWAGCRVASKVITRTDSPATLVAWQSIMLAVFTLPAALWVWQWPSLGQLALLCVIAALATTTQWLINWGIKLADLAVVEPISYLRLVWAGVVGFAVFGEIPATFTVLGAGVILASVLYIIYRERRETRAQPVGPAEA